MVFISLCELALFVMKKTCALQQAHIPHRERVFPNGERRAAAFIQSGSAVVFLTVRSTSMELERSTPGSRINTSVWKRSRSSASR